jgi:hypothetical protein
LVFAITLSSRPPAIFIFFLWGILIRHAIDEVFNEL